MCTVTCIYPAKLNNQGNIFFFRQAIPGSYTITLLVYSGVPDPTWPISCSVEEQLCHEIEHAPKEDEPPAILGYRGFRMQPMECEECDEFILVGPDSKDVQHAVLDTAPPDIVDDELREYVRQAIDDQ